MVLKGERGGGGDIILFTPHLGYAQAGVGRPGEGPHYYYLPRSCDARCSGAATAAVPPGLHL